MTQTIRPTRAGDIPALSQVLDQTGLFPAELLPDLLAGFLAGDPEALWLTLCQGGAARGFCYARLEPLTDRTWNLVALAVHPAHQGAGRGAALVGQLEAALRAEGQRLLIVETSGSAGFARTRRFYAGLGYAGAAVVPGFWAEDDDKLILHKRL